MDVIPYQLGLGMYAAGWIADAPAFTGSARAPLGGVVAYVVFADLLVARPSG